MLFSSLLVLLTISSSAFAGIGDTCRAAGVKGTCQKIEKCTNGITVKDACPNDPAGVRCCIKKSCQEDATKKQGMCFDKRNTQCSGKFITGQCPGDANMQCCIKATTPPPPQCPGAKSIPIKFFPDDVLFSRAGTKITAKVYKGGSKVLDVCDLVAGALPGPGQAVGIACGIGSLGAGFIGDHADECAKKNQCLKLRAYTIPFCVGSNDGCCG